MPSDYAPSFTVKIGGSDVSKEFMDDVLRIVIDATLHMPCMCTIELRDPSLKWADDTALLALGKEVEISAQTGEEWGGLSGTLFKGEIAGLEPHFSGQGENKMVIRSYDKSHRLHRGRKTQTYLDKKDSDLVSQIASAAGLTPNVQSTSETYEYVLQYNQTDMEFLLARADRIGYQVLVDEGTLYFQKGDWTQGGEVPELKLGESLLSFEPCWSGTHQADKVVVQSWDPKNKEGISVEKTPNSALSQGGMTGTGGGMASSAFGTAKVVIATTPVFTVGEATAIAEGMANDISRGFVSAEGVCLGDPRIKAGGKVKITGVGDRFSGEYLVTSVLHTYAESGYETRFGISGRKPNALSYLLDAGNGHAQAQGLVNGVVPAKVTNLGDPDDIGRIKVMYPWLPKDGQGVDTESSWVRVSPPMAGAERGLLYLPEIDDEVLVAFEHGDIHRPYVIGGLWSSTDKPPEPNSEAVVDGKVVHRMIKTRKGHVILLDDSDDAELISITSQGGRTVVLDDGNKLITIDDGAGNTMEIEAQGNSMTIKVGGDFTVEAGGKVTIKSTQDMSLESQANANIKAMSNASVEGTGGLALKSTAKAELNSTGPLSVSSSAITEIKGSLVKIN